MITKKDLLKRLKNEKFKINNRMLTHFISLGLIEKPMHLGLGKGKGSVTKFNDRTFQDIKEIMKLHKEGLTYEEIKYKRMSWEGWQALVNQLRESSKSEKDVTNFIKKIPYLSDREKGRLKLTSDITIRLTNVVVDELESIFGPINDEGLKEALIYDVNNAIEFCISNVFCDFGLSDEDYEEYLNKGTVCRFGKIYFPSKRSY